MVLVAVEFKARVPGMALFLSRVTVDVLASVGVAHLELVSRPYASTPPIGWSEKLAGQVTHENFNF